MNSASAVSLDANKLARSANAGPLPNSTAFAHSLPTLFVGLRIRFSRAHDAARSL